MSNPTPSTGQVQIQTSAQKSPAAINVANYLFQNPILKQRIGLLDNKNDLEFFRYKRFERALLSDDYKTKQQNPRNGLPPISNVEEVQKVFVLLIQNQMIIPIKKLHFSEVKAIKGWKPNREKPTLKRSEKAVVDPNFYYGWLYTKPNPYILLYSILAVVGIFTIILFPLWPNFMRRGVWYLSMAALGLIGLLFATAIVRFIIYVISLVAFPKPFWLFPNLFEDCGFFESFVPLYGWEEPKKKKSKKSKKSKTTAVDDNNEGNEKVEPILTSAEKNATGVKATENGSNGAKKSKRKVTLEEVADE